MCPLIPPAPEPGPHAVLTLACDWCGLVYDESATITPQVLARPGAQPAGQPPGGHGCPRCGTREGQRLIARGER